MKKTWENIKMKQMKNLKNWKTEERIKHWSKHRKRLNK